MKVKKWNAVVATVVLAGAAAATSAGAMPLSQQLAGARSDTASGVEQVHLRPWRHCHWRKGYRWCHGPHYVNPGFGFYFGPSIRLHRHHHHKHHKH